MFRARQHSRSGQTSAAWLVLLVILLCCSVTVTQAAQLMLGEHAARPGSNVKVPVSIPDATGIATVSLQLNFDPLNLSLVGVTNGTLGGGFALDYRVEDGKLILAAVSDTALVAGAGNLVVLTFRVNTGALPGTTTPLALAQGNIGGQHGRDFSWAQAVSAADGQVRVVTNDSDSDLDGLPDWWEEQYFGGPTLANAALDSDGDGMIDGQEYVAGTDPLDGASVLRVTVAGFESGGFRLVFPTVQGVVYRILRSGDLSSWAAVGSDISGTGTSAEVIDHTALNASTRYYRVMVVR